MQTHTEKILSCPGCNGRVVLFSKPFLPNPDLLGFCAVCVGAYLNADGDTATARCSCDPRHPNDKRYFFTDKGSDGWIHQACWQIVQTGKEGTP